MTMKNSLGSYSLLFIIFFSITQHTGSMYLGQNWGHVLGAERIEQPRCVGIPQNFSLCHGIQYDLMRLPNLLDHETLDEAIQQSDAWNSLLRLHCHADTKLFLCSVFAPVCVPEMDKPIYPCQSLCRAVQEGCENRMLQYGFSWPDMLNCSRYPEDNDMCIRRPIEDQHDSSQSSSHSHSRMFFPSHNQSSNQTKIELTKDLTTMSPQLFSQFDLKTTIVTMSVESSKSPSSTTTLKPFVETTTNLSFVEHNTTPHSSSETNTPKNLLFNQNLDSKRECSSCAQVPTYENILDNFCRANTVFKAKVRPHNSTHLLIQRIQRTFKPQRHATQPPQQQHQSRFIQISEDLDCQCSGGKNNRMAGNYLVMSGDAITVSTINARLIMPWQQKDKIFKSAIRKFRRVNCGTLGREIRESVLLKQNRRQQQSQLQF